MKYLFYEKETDTKAKVDLIYYQTPSQELLEREHVEIEEIPEPENQLRKVSVLYCNPQTKEVWYEYEEEKREDEMKNLNEQIQALNIAMAEILGM